ncbi:hypothetical protein BH09VER1_BH09VER1_18550 [soil metagenome]
MVSTPVAFLKGVIMSKLSIVFAHRAPADYLLYTVAQLRATNPEADIHVLLDYEDPFVSRYAKVASIFDYLPDVREFERDWVNFSSLGYHYECFCSQRWLILRNYALAHGLRRFIYLDSDVMTYSNLEADLAPFAAHPISYAGGSAHTLFVEDFDCFVEFCQFLMNRYRDASSLQEMHQQYRLHKERTPHGGISDMSHWVAFERKLGRSFGNLTATNEGVVVSTHSKISNPVTKQLEAVDFAWKEGRPFAQDRYSNEFVRYSTVHYQGSFKYLIARSFTGPAASGIKKEIRLRALRRILAARGLERFLGQAGALDYRSRRLTFVP